MSEPVGVVVVSWNGLEHLRACIPAILSQDYPAQAIVVDNGSTDGSVDWLRSAYPQVQVICNAANRGFAGATNQGIALATGPYVALLNNDARPEPGWLGAMVAVMERGQQVGMVAPQICFAHRPDLLDSAGIEVDVLGVAWNCRMGRPAAQEPTEPQAAFGPSGAAALYRRAMLDEIGLFEERFFAYYEDVELAWRAQRAGWRCLYAPRARVLHQHSATGRQGSDFKSYHLSRNRVWTLIRHYSAGRFLLWWPGILVWDMLTWLAPLLGGRTASMRGHLDALRHWRWAWEERRRCSGLRHPIHLIPPRIRATAIPR